MLFTAAPFALVFLPLTLLGFFALGRWRPPLAALWLLAASLFFYAFWLPELVALLLASIIINFWVGKRIAAASAGSRQRKLWLIVGIVFNLGLLAYFKYANFFVDSINAAFGMNWHLARVLLPIGISFYSFTQIAYLVDTHRGEVRESNPVHYGLFVTYFPHLIAGPVLHHAQMMPQFALRETYRFDGANFAAGLAIFCIGLVKKVVFADGIAPYADAVFDPADAGKPISTPSAWLGALAYTLQLYFDFSGYSDMAIGLSWMFNIRLPINFDSPYKSTSISEFWRRWHISLSTFLRDYLYFALGGNRHGAVRRYLNLLATMVLGGLWHGAGWAFVAWGTLHGVYLMVNHGFRALCGSALCARLDRSRAFALVSWCLTLLAVIVAWVPFRAHTWGGASSILQAMVPGAGAGADDWSLWNAGLQGGVGFIWCLALGAIALLAPNSNRIGDLLLGYTRAHAHGRWAIGSLALCGALFLVLINLSRSSVSAFIYFNF